MTTSERPSRRSSRILWWGGGLALGALIFPVAAIPAFVLGVIAAARNHVFAAVAIMLSSLIFGYVGVQFALSLWREQNAIETADLRYYEQELPQQLEDQYGEEFTRTICVRHEEYQARCSAFWSQDRLRVIVDVDPDDGSWTWRSVP